MKRLAAALAAVAMVAVAVVVRSAIDDDDGGGRRSGDGALVVLCAIDLREVCEQLDDSVDVLIAEPATTAAELADGAVDREIDAWITSTAWLEVTDSRAPGALGDARAIATSPVTIATAPGRHDAIRELCAGQDVWRCLGEGAGTSWADLGTGSSAWGDLKTGLTDPDLAQGLPVLASAAVGYFGRTDFAANDLALDFEAWLGDLARPSGSGDDDPALKLATRPGTYSAAGANGAEVGDLGARGVMAIEPQVPVATTIAIVELRGGDGLPDTGALQAALEDDGWSPAGEDDLAPTLKPGVMAALHTLWRAVTS